MDVVLVGDSHVEGLIKHFPGSIARRGWSTVRYSKAWPALPPANTAVIVLGMNDTGTSAAVLERAMRLAVDRLAVTHRQIVWVGPPKVTRPELVGPLARVAEVQRETAGRLGIRWIDGRQLTRAPGDDGIHYTAAGYAEWAASLRAVLGGGPPTLRAVVLAFLGVAALVGAVS